MFLAVASGSHMGPGDGWFRPGQGRFGWDWLAKRYDANNDKSISREEFKGPSEYFDRLDRDRDGALKADDLDWSERSPFVRQAGQTGMWFRMLDGNSNGRITKEEWDAFFARVAKDKGHVTAEDLRRVLIPPAGPPSPKDMPSTAVLISGLLKGELGSILEGPAVGDPAPDFVLKRHDGQQTVQLAALRGKKPVVLIFGSFT